MQLREYLFRYKITQKKFAQQLGIHRDYLSRISSGKFKPSKHLALLIELITDHQVTVDDIVENVE